MKMKTEYQVFKIARDQLSFKFAGTLKECEAWSSRSSDLMGDVTYTILKVYTNFSRIKTDEE